jgi:hypothetical protein
MRLRAMEFSIEDSGTVLRECDDETDIFSSASVRIAILSPRVRESNRSDRLV